MANIAIERISALHGYPTANLFNDDNSDLSLFEVSNLRLFQVTTWPDKFLSLSGSLCQELAVSEMPLPGKALISPGGTILHVEPLKYLMVGGECPDINLEAGACLDLSHSRTHIRVRGKKSAELLNRYLSLDLRDKVFPVGTAASTAMHHIGITLWRSQQECYELLLPRAFAISLWDLLAEAAHQFRI